MSSYWSPFMWIVLLATVLSGLIVGINRNTLPYDGLADGQRYSDLLASGAEGRPALLVLLPLTWFGNFEWAGNFLLYIILGWIVYNVTKDYWITLLLLLGFSTTLLTTFNLFAQALVFLPGLYFWLNVPAEKRKDLDMPEELRFREWGHNQGKWLIYLLFATFAHKFGLVFVVSMFFAKRIGGDDVKKMQRMFIFLYIAAMLALALSDRSLRLTFFYPTLIPFDLGSVNTYFWIAFLSAPVAYLFSKTKNQAALAFAGFLLISAVWNQLGGSGLEIDFWRFLIFFEWIALIEIWRARAELGKLYQWIWVLLLFGVVRLLTGLFL